MSTLKTAPGDRGPRPQLQPAEVPDTHSQLEEMLGAVWRAEANWRLDDRLDLAAEAELKAKRNRQR